jgi:hypothetical protein
MCDSLSKLSCLQRITICCRRCVFCSKFVIRCWNGVVYNKLAFIAESVFRSEFVIPCRKCVSYSKLVIRCRNWVARISIRCRKCVFCSEFMIRCWNWVVCSESPFVAKDVCSATNLWFAVEIELSQWINIRCRRCVFCNKFVIRCCKWVSCSEFVIHCRNCDSLPKLSYLQRSSIHCWKWVCCSEFMSHDWSDVVCSEFVIRYRSSIVCSEIMIRCQNWGACSETVFVAELCSL